jgi:outer membrane protein assembly factor BamB
MRNEAQRLKRFMIFLSAALWTASVLALGAESPMFRGDLSHTGAYDGDGVRQFAKIKWKFLTHGRVYSSPAIVEGVAFFGSTDHNFYAVRLDDGTLKWKFEAGSGITSSPAIAEGKVYFGSYDGDFYCLNAETGKLEWKFTTGGERRFTARHLHGMLPAAESMPDPFDFYLSSPAVWGGKVYFGSGDGNVYAVEAASGKVDWKVTTGDVVHASPAIADGVVYVGSWDSYFYAIDAVTGGVRWRFKTGEDAKIYNQVGIQSSAAVADGVVYFGCRDSKLYAVDAATGKERWRFDNKGSWVITSPAIRDGKVYFATSDSTQLIALEAKTGSQVFALKLKWPMFSSPAIAGGMVYIGSHEGKLLEIDLATQQLASAFQTDGSRQYGAAYTKPDGGPDYAAAFADEFYEETVVGVHKMLSVGAILSSPVVSQGVIYFGSSDGNLYALN